MTLSKLLNLSGSQFSHRRLGDIDRDCLMRVSESF